MRFRVRFALLAVALFIVAPALARADGGNWHTGGTFYDVPDCRNGASFDYWIPQGGYHYIIGLDDGSSLSPWPISCSDPNGCYGNTTVFDDPSQPGISRFTITFVFYGDEPPPPEDLPFIYDGYCL
jgi:hypothetical protein